MAGFLRNFWWRFVRLFALRAIICTSCDYLHFVRLFALRAIICTSRDYFALRAIILRFARCGRVLVAGGVAAGRVIVAGGV